MVSIFVGNRYCEVDVDRKLAQTLKTHTIGSSDFVLKLNRTFEVVSAGVG